MPELLPCPFCGCEDIEVTQNTQSDYMSGWYWTVGCTACEAEFAVSTEAADAIARWNTRVG